MPAQPAYPGLRSCSRAPIVAFMVASPLTSPSKLLHSVGLFGWPFSVTFFAASIVLGLVGEDQARFKPVMGGAVLVGRRLLAFLIPGAGTSIGAITGALTIARWRAVGPVVGTLWVGAVAIGYVYNAAMALGWV
jgi:uncharacterized membrane protein YraQ (UPF0718 family)